MLKHKFLFNISRFFVIFLIIGFFAGSTSAANLTGQEILKKVETARRAKTVELKNTMFIYNESGDKRERTIRIYHKQAEIEKSLIKFLAPADVEGTGFLSLKNNQKEEMYLYLPALGTIKKISGSQKNGSFVGTDFSYNDLTVLSGANYTDNYSAELLEEDKEYYFLKLDPKDDYEYKFAKMQVRKDIFYPVKIEFYDQSDNLIKIMTHANIEKIASNWLARKISMENVEKGSKTVMMIDEVSFGKSLADELFTTRYLRRN